MRDMPPGGGQSIVWNMMGMMVFPSRLARLISLLQFCDTEYLVVRQAITTCRTSNPC